MLSQATFYQENKVFSQGFASENCFFFSTSLNSINIFIFLWPAIRKKMQNLSQNIRLFSLRLKHNFLSSSIQSKIRADALRGKLSQPSVRMRSIYILKL